jgi:hypothetical protein
MRKFPLFSQSLYFRLIAMTKNLLIPLMMLFVSLTFSAEGHIGVLNPFPYDAPKSLDVPAPESVTGNNLYTSVATMIP